MNQNPSENADDPKRSSADTAMEILRLLRWSMAQVLTPRQYQVFALCFLEGMPQKEIAAEMGLSVSSVSKIYTSALKKLRRLWNA